MKKHNRATMTKRKLCSTLLGTAICILVFLLLALIISAVLINLQNPLASVKIAFFALFLTSAAISGFINAKRSAEKEIRSAILSSALLITIIFTASLIINSGKVSLYVAMNALCYILITMIFAFISKNGKQRKAKRRHRR